MKVAVIPVTPFQQNCSLLICERSGQAALVDPGGDLEVVLDAVENSEVRLEKVLLTHGHIDHCGATAELRKRFGVPVEGPHVEDQFWIDQLPQQARQFGFGELESFVPDRYLKGGDTVSFGDISMEVRYCPGHTPGHVVFFHRERRLAFVGDVLFKGSIGRTDFPRGDLPTLIESITAQLWPLGEDVTFVPGHGPISTFGEERQSNPFVSDRALSR